MTEKEILRVAVQAWKNTLGIVGSTFPTPQKRTEKVSDAEPDYYVQYGTDYIKEESELAEYEKNELNLIIAVHKIFSKKMPDWDRIVVYMQIHRHDHTSGYAGEVVFSINFFGK